MLLFELSRLSNTWRHIRVVFTSWYITRIVVRNAVWTNVWIVHIVLLLHVLEGSKFRAHCLLRLISGRGGSSWRHALSHSIWVNSVGFWIIVLVLDGGDVPVSSDVFFMNSNVVLHHHVVRVILGLLSCSDRPSEFFFVVLQLTSLDFGGDDGLFSRDVPEGLLLESEEEWLDFADSRCHSLGKASGIGHDHGVDGTLAASVLGDRGKMASEFDSLLKRHGDRVLVTVNRINIVHGSRDFGVLDSDNTGDSRQLSSTHSAGRDNFDLAVSLLGRLGPDEKGTLSLWWQLSVLVAPCVVCAVSIVISFHHVCISVRILFDFDAIIVGVIIAVLWLGVILRLGFSRPGEIVLRWRKLLLASVGHVALHAGNSTIFFLERVLVLGALSLHVVDWVSSDIWINLLERDLRWNVDGRCSQILLDIVLLVVGCPLGAFFDLLLQLSLNVLTLGFDHFAHLNSNRLHVFLNAIMDLFID